LWHDSQLAFENMVKLRIPHSEGTQSAFILYSVVKVSVSLFVALFIALSEFSSFGSPLWPRAAPRPAAPLATVSSFAEKTLHQLVTADLKMTGHIAKDAGQSPHLDRSMVWDGDVVLTSLARGEPQVASSLPRDLVSEFLECPGQFRAGDISR